MINMSSSNPRSPTFPAHKALVGKHPNETSLEELIDAHISTLHATADAVHATDQGKASAGTRMSVMREEAACRQAIFNYRPQSEREITQKMTYVAAYILKTGNALTPQEMDLLLGAPRRM